MNMKQVFESAMNGTFDLTDMLSKINTHHICGNLTDADRDVLIATARSKADPMGGLDITAKLAEFERRIRALEEANQGSTSGGADTDTVAEYVPGKWYRTGDRCTYEGAVYTCIAPDGVVCVWSPAEYPAYWGLA